MSLKSRLDARLGPVTGGGDFAARRREQQRQAAAAERKRKADAQRARVNARIAAVRARERQAADKRVAAARRKRTRPGSSKPTHDYRRCRDADCQRPACGAYQEGFAEGFAAASEE